MIKKIMLTLGVVMLFAACSDDASEKPYIRKPLSIDIQKNGAWDGFIKTDETEEACKAFVLSAQDVKEFIMTAQEETEVAYTQSTLKSRCFAEGELSLPRKFKGRWRIDKSRHGILMVENDQAYFFYCDLCGSRNYAQRR